MCCQHWRQGDEFWRKRRAKLPSASFLVPSLFLPDRGNGILTCPHAKVRSEEGSFRAQFSLIEFWKWLTYQHRFLEAHRFHHRNVDLNRTSLQSLTLKFILNVFFSCWIWVKSSFHLLKAPSAIFSFCVTDWNDCWLESINAELISWFSRSRTKFSRWDDYPATGDWIHKTLTTLSFTGDSLY
jgi:hypothetical protein